VPVELKWPNDVLVSGKKSAGILLETALGPSARQVVAIGIGINVGAQAVPRELADRATSLALEHGRTVPRRRLLSRLLSQLEREWLGFARGADAAILSGWMRYSRMHEGTEVSIEDGGGRRTATTAGLTELGALRVRIDGREEIVLSADVTVRLGV
jgi:BirA family biotin operon repressor/biotin-[acetyl-CoA-carboxylase] ligase